MGIYKRNKHMYALFVLPALLIFIVFIAVPTIQTLISSMYLWDGGVTKKFIGFNNFMEFFTDAKLKIALRNSILWVVASVFIILPLSYIFAELVYSKVKGFKFFRTIYYLPSILSEMSIAIIWMFILNPNIGLMNSLLKKIGLEGLIMNWLGDTHLAIFACILANIWGFSGSYMLIFLGEIKGLPKEIFEAADIDGATGINKIFAIRIPMLWGTIRTVIILSICYSVQHFGIVFGLTGGGPSNSSQTLGTYMYRAAYQEHYFGYASAIAVLIFIISYSLILISNKIMNKNKKAY